MIYVRRKDFTELKDRIKVKIEGKHYLDIFIWNSYAALLQNTGHAQDDDVGATYISTPFLEDNETGERIFSPKYGEMHLVHNKFGGGVFAHELDVIEHPRMADQLEDRRPGAVNVRSQGGLTGVQ